MTRNRSRSLVWVLLIALLLFALFTVWKSSRYQKHYTAAEARKASLPIPIGVAQAKVTNLDATVGAGGQVLQYTTITVTSRIAATAQKVPANVGNTIHSGEVLLEDDQRPFQAALQSSKAQLESDRAAMEQTAAALKSVENLKAKGMATGLEVLNARTELAAKQSAFEEAKVKLLKSELDLEATRVASPVDGIVLARFVNANERVEANQVLMQLGNLEKVYLLAQVQEESIASIHEGQPTETFFSAFPTTTFKGKVERVDPRVDPKTRAFTAYVAVDNSNLKLKPGLTGFARIRLQKTALAVPTVAVVNPFGEHASVFVINDDSRAILTPVRVGLEANGMMEIVSGLKEGTRVATAGTVDLKNNDRVSVELSR
ncbi:MAG: efflux RND transporter periplasmic adaptor subunit [Spartobacteria bacterium]